ncbi:MAG: hypothetical protein LUG66_09720 [Clostridiales bacterium]|nr:hypothetical protein [Clostridiales bacterium]
MKELIIGNEKIIVVEPEERDEYLSDSDREMDARARQAVKVAIEKAKFCKKPVARYDVAARKAYIEYPDGEKRYAD